MKNFKLPLPDIDSWHCVTEAFRNRVTCPRQSTQLNRCIDQQFMTVQSIISGLQPGSRYQSPSLETLLHDLKLAFSQLFELMSVQFNYDCFGRPLANQFYEHDFLGLWCLVLEVATLATDGSTVELSMGSLEHGIELEIGSDCGSLEQARILQSLAFKFASQLMPITRAVDLKCPLGGGAIQVDILGKPHGQQRKVA